MPEGLIIVESPAKARTLKRFLGDRFDVLASMGHVRDLPGNEMGVEVEAGSWRDLTGTGVKGSR